MTARPGNTTRRDRRDRATDRVPTWFLVAVVAVPLAAGPAPAPAAEPRGFVPAATRAWNMPFAAPAGAGSTSAKADAPTDETERRLYVTGMVGSSLSPPAVDHGVDAAGPLGGAALAGEGAIGVAIPQPVGGWRFEVEGRHRGAAATGDAAGRAAATATGEWTTTANAWREVPLVGDVGAYAGGGLGFGDAAARGPRGGGVAWKAGGGLAWAWTERVTFDVGYRLQGLEGVGGAAGTAPAGEVLFAVRVFEPFRAWRRE
jgi:opacity protein-like surface antigen